MKKRKLAPYKQYIKDCIKDYKIIRTRKDSKRTLLNVLFAQIIVEYMDSFVGDTDFSLSDISADLCNLYSLEYIVYVRLRN